MLLAPVRDATIRSAQELLASGRVDEAEVVLKRASQASPRDAAVWNLLGAVHASRGDMTAAETDFTRATELDPQLASAWLNLGRVCQLRSAEPGYLDRGIAAYRNVLKLDPGSAEAHHQLGVLLHWKGDFSASLDHLARLPVEDATRKSVLALRCANLAALGRTDQALEAASALLAVPGLEEADVTAVMPAIVAHNDVVALHLLDALRAKGLAGPDSLAGAAALHEKRGELDAARVAFEQLYQTNPKNAAPLLELARIAWKQKDWDGTLSYLAHARDLDPNNPAVHFLFGLAANERRVPIDARKSLEKALELAPGNPVYHYALGVLQLQWQDKESAVPHLEKYVAAHPEDSRGRLALGLALFHVYKLDEAKAQLTPITSDPATRTGAEFLLGRIAAQQDQADAAIAHFRRAIAADPSSADAHAELGAVYFGQDDTASARTETETALRLNPKSYTANQTLAKLYQLAGDPRAKEQSDRLKSLIEERDADAKLLQRSIEVRPW